MTDVADVEEEIGGDGVLQGGAKRGDEKSGQIGEEADGVDEKITES